MTRHLATLIESIVNPAAFTRSLIESLHIDIHKHLRRERINRDQVSPGYGCRGYTRVSRSWYRPTFPSGPTHMYESPCVTVAMLLGLQTATRHHSTWLRPLPHRQSGKPETTRSCLPDNSRIHGILSHERGSETRLSRTHRFRLLRPVRLVVHRRPLRAPPRRPLLERYTPLVTCIRRSRDTQPPPHATYHLSTSSTSRPWLHVRRSGFWVFLRRLHKTHCHLIGTLAVPHTRPVGKPLPALRVPHGRGLQCPGLTVCG